MAASNEGGLLNVQDGLAQTEPYLVVDSLTTQFVF